MSGCNPCGGIGPNGGPTGGGGGGGGDTTAEYILGSADAGLPNSRVLVDGQNTVANFGVAGQVSLDVVFPGATFWTFANDGGPADGIIHTTDATPFFRTWATLPAVGATVNFYGMFTGVSDDGNQCLFRMQQGGFGRNAIGENALYPVAAVTLSGYDELGTGAAPWNNLGPNPAGWGGGMNFTPGGGIIQVAANGAAGRNVDWTCLLIIFPFHGAVISV